VKVSSVVATENDSRVDGVESSEHAAQIQIVASQVGPSRGQYAGGSWRYRPSALVAVSSRCSPLTNEVELEVECERRVKLGQTDIER
jgi:hypothetical protein